VYGGLIAVLFGRQWLAAFRRSRGTKAITAED
jgi:hypothetical protein